MILIAIVGIALVSVAVWPFIVYLRFFPYGTAEAKKVACVLHHDESFGFFSPIDTYRVDVSFHYVVDGEDYKSNRIFFSGKGICSSENKAKKIREKALARNFCHFSKRDPSFAYLLDGRNIGDRDGKTGTLVAGAGLIALFFFFRYMGL